MKSKKLHLLLLTLFGSACLLATASARTLSAVYFRPPAGAPEKVQATHSKGTIEVLLPRMNLSIPVKIPAGDLVLRITLEPVPTGAEIPAGAPTITIPAAWTDVILLFSVNPKDPAFPFSVTPLNASAASFKPGEIIVFNRTDATIGAKLGDEGFKLTAGATTKVNLSKAPEGDYPMHFGYIPAGETEARPLANSTYRNQPTLRQILFILPEPTRQVPRIWSVAVHPPQPEEPASAVAPR
ncbi:MAG: hypothetical protein ABI600_18045 [Luteolibacter sp.]